MGANSLPAGCSSCLSDRHLGTTPVVAQVATVRLAMDQVGDHRLFCRHSPSATSLSSLPIPSARARGATPTAYSCCQPQSCCPSDSLVYCRHCAPFFEELLFRGFLLPSLASALPLPWAIALSSCGFALMHFNLSDLLPLTALGVFLGYIYWRSRNLLAPILLHSLWNSGSFLALVSLGQS